MSDRPFLADLLELAIVTHGPSSGSALAAKVVARKAAVLEELRTNPRFECLGRGRGSRWRLAVGNRIDEIEEPLGTDSGVDRPDRLSAEVPSGAVGRK
jgi:hypothetical protein